MAELELLHDPHDGGGLERLLQHRQHLQLVLLADALDVLEHRRAATAHELDEAEIAALGQREDRFDRLAGFEPDIEEDQLGRALGGGLGERLSVGEFFGVDPAPVQDQRQEVADAGVFVDDEADRHAGAAGAGVGGASIRASGIGVPRSRSSWSLRLVPRRAASALNI